MEDQGFLKNQDVRWNPYDGGPKNTIKKSQGIFMKCFQTDFINSYQNYWKDTTSNDAF